MNSQMSCFNHGTIFAVDPLDKKYVRIGPSEFQEGCFAKRLIPKDTVFALYGGHVLSKQEQEELMSRQGNEIDALNKTGQYFQEELLTLTERFWMYR